MSLTWKIAVDNLPASRKVWPARVSIPNPRGHISPLEYSVQCPDGHRVPAQARVLTSWPDGAPRWVQLDFQTTASGEHIVHEGAVPHEPKLPVQYSRDDDWFTVSVGRLRVGLGPQAANPVTSITWNSRELMQDDWQLVALDENGQPFPLAAGAAHNITIEAAGPHRFQLSWETQHVEGLLAARMRLEFLAGVEGFTFSYQFFHKQPGNDELQLRSITSAFPLDVAGRAVVVQQAYSNIGLRRFVRVQHPVVLHVDGTRYAPHVKSAAVLDDTFEYPPFLQSTNIDTGSAVAIEDESVAVLFAMRDFECHRPKTLTVAPGHFGVGIWPEEAGVLRLPQGRSARQVFSFLFTDPDAARIDLELSNPVAVQLEPAVGWLHKDDSHHAGATWDQPRLLDGSTLGAPFFSHLLHTATGRWETVTEMFNYGDTPDVGYSVAYPSSGRTPGQRDDYKFMTNRVLHDTFFHPSTVPPVWSNNEYDVIYCMALEALRTRDAKVRQKLIAAARHQIEVDFVHYSDHWQQHRATPQHSYDHVTMMSAIPSHQWTQGLYYYYAMTGDDDVPEVVRAICDFNIDYIERDETGFALFFNRELGWALVALMFGYELTAAAGYLEMAEKIIHKLEQDAGRSDFVEVEKLSGTSVGLNATGIGIGFNQNTIPLGLKVYHQATGAKWAFDLLHEWVAFGMTNYNDKTTGVKLSELFPETFCYVCELTGDTKWLSESLWQLRLFFLGYNDLGWMNTHGGSLDTKHYARIYRGLSFYLAALARSGLLEEFENTLMGSAAPGGQ